MPGKTLIEWTDATWNPIRGCTRVSPGCGGPGPHGGCYAERVAARFSGPGMPYEGLAEMRDGKARWTGRLTFGHDLDAPLRWRKARRIFVNSMSDLFHERLTVAEIATVYAVCVAAHVLNGHSFQILTKRSGRMRAVLHDPAFWDQVNAEAGAHVLARTDPQARRSTDARAKLDSYGPHNPPFGIELGVSAEDQRRANERVPDLLATPATVRFVSAEPLLGPIDFEHLPQPDGTWINALRGTVDATAQQRAEQPRPWLTKYKWGLDGIIVGGESGPRARPMHPDWARDIRNACRRNPFPVAFYFKQWGEWAPGTLNREWAILDAQGALDIPDGRAPDPAAREVAVTRVGKKRAGRLLDGQQHDALPTPPF